MTLKSTATAAVPSIVALVAVALAIRFYGNQPFISDIKEGLKGNAK